MIVYVEENIKEHIVKGFSLLSLRNQNVSYRNYIVTSNYFKQHMSNILCVP